jgi:tetratricopeptide (TPR) repeat protein
MTPLTDLINTLAIKEKQYAIDPFSDVTQLNLLPAYLNLGKAYEEQDNLVKAKEYYKKHYKLLVDLHDDAPAKWKADLGTATERMGDTHLQLDELQDAAAYYKKAVELADIEFTANPDAYETMSALAYCYMKLGDTLNKREYYDEAEECYIKAVDLQEEYHDNHPESGIYKHELAEAYVTLADFHSPFHQEYNEDIYALYEAAAAIYAQMLDEYPLSQYRDGLRYAEEGMNRYPNK